MKNPFLCVGTPCLNLGTATPEMDLHKLEVITRSSSGDRVEGNRLEEEKTQVVSAESSPIRKNLGRNRTDGPRYQGNI